MDHAAVQKWLDNYVEAWKSYDEEKIVALFSQDAQYYYGPYRQPLRGRDAIIADWLVNPDPPNSFTASYRPLVVEGNTAVANGRSTYFEADGQTLKREFDNIFLLRFDQAGRCTEFTEWFMEKPKER